MLDYNSATTFYIMSQPTDMRKGKDGLASYVREILKKNPLNSQEAFIFYSKNYKTVRILHHDFSGYEMYSKWFDDGKFLKPVFTKIAATHQISKSQILLLMSNAVQTKIILE